MRWLFVAVLLLLGLTACASEQDPGLMPGPPEVEVDTPELRQVKARIGMDDCQPGSGEPVEGGLPEVTLACLGGGPDVDLSTLRGPLVINLWQAFCGPCRKEMPALESFHQQYGDQVRVLGIDYNDVHPEAALALAEDTSATYPSLADPGGELVGEDHVSVRGLPAFVFVDADGEVTATVTGGVESAAEVKDLVRQHLGIEL